MYNLTETVIRERERETWVRYKNQVRVQSTILITGPLTELISSSLDRVTLRKLQFDLMPVITGQHTLADFREI